MTFEEFAAAELDPLLRFAKVLCVDRGLAEDVVQEVLARAMAKWAAIGELDQPRAYVRRMIVNEFLSWRRKWSRVSPVAALPETVTSGPADRVADRVQLVAELRKLPPPPARRLGAALLRQAERHRDRRGSRLHRRHRPLAHLARPGRAASRGRSWPRVDEGVVTVRTEADLQDVLAALEADAPTVPEVTRPAASPRRPRHARRGWLLPVLAAVAVLVVALGITLTQRSQSARPAVPAPPAPPLRLDLRVDPVPGLVFGNISIAPGGQGQIDIFTSGGAFIGVISRTTASALALWPVVDKVPVTVAGHAALYAKQLLPSIYNHGPSAAAPATGTANQGVPIVYWQASSTSWIVISSYPYGSAPADSQYLTPWGANPRARLLAVAAAVHTDESTAVFVPFRFTARPAAMTVENVDSHPASPGPGASVAVLDGAVSLGIVANQLVGYFAPIPGSTPIRFGSYTGYLDPGCGLEPGPSGASGATAPRSSCNLTFRAGPWEVRVSADGPGSTISSTTLTSVAIRLVFATDPGDTHTWFDATNAI